MKSDSIITQINRLEAWLGDQKGNYILLPVRLIGYLVLILFMMFSNLWAIIRWPFAALLRITKGSVSTTSDLPEKNLVDADNELMEILLEKEELVLADFWAEWCGPCIMMSEPIKRLSRKHGDKCTIAKINTTNNSSLTQNYNVKGLPTLILFKDGEEIKRYAGALSYSELVDFITE